MGWWHAQLSQWGETRPTAGHMFQAVVPRPLWGTMELAWLLGACEVCPACSETAPSVCKHALAITHRCILFKWIQLLFSA